MKIFVILIIYFCSYFFAYAQEILWEWEPEKKSFGLTSPAIGKNGTIYVAGQNYLYAINLDGNLKWEINWTIQNQKNTSSVTDSPVIGEDNTIYGRGRNGDLYAVNPNGSLKWKFRPTGRMWSSPALSVDGTLYAGCSEYSFYAINPDGSEKWKIRLDGNVNSSPAIGADGTIYVRPALHKKLYAINPEGSIMWVTQLEENSHQDTLPVIGIDGKIYIGKNAVNPDGSNHWVNDNIIGGNNVYANAISSDNNLIYCVFGNGLWPVTINSIKSNGDRNWIFQNENNIEALTFACIGNTGAIYFGATKPRFKGNPQQDLLVALKSDGTIKWTLELEWDGFPGRMQTPTNSSPTISDNGIIYIGNGGKLYAIKTLSTDSDDSPWPMLGQNAQGHKRAPKIILPPVDPNPINPDKPIDVTGNAPYILKQPKSKTINAGQTVSFSVEVAGDQPISFQWFRDQALLANETKNSITIENANPNLDIGDYYVIAKNKNGSNKSINARLRIIDKSELQITNKIFKSGKRLIFQANTPFLEEGIVVQKTKDFKKWVDIKKIQGLGLVTIIVDIEGNANYYYRLKIGD